jgi:Zn-dependent protease with chaperone function
VFVSRGALALLDRDETQVLVAHELAHIRNDDLHIFARLTTLNRLYLLAPQLGWYLLRQLKWGGSRGKNPEGLMNLALRAAIWFIFLPFSVLLSTAGWGQVAIMRLSQAAITRQRESLADASALQFTRNPGAMKNVLAKIAVYGGLPGGTALSYAHFEHCCFTSVKPGRWFDTHPSIEDRIQGLDPRHAPAEFAECGSRQLSGGELAVIAARIADQAKQARETHQR